MTGRVGDEQLETWYLTDERPRPWLAVNMVSSVDGGTAIGGRSSAIGDRQDTVVFRSLRAVSDLVLVAAETVRAEGYGPVRLPDHLERWRLGHQMPTAPRIAIVSNSLDFDLDAFDGASPIIMTSEGSPSDRRARLDEQTDVIVAGDDRVDLTMALDALRERGHGRVLCEGGPTLNGQLASADLVDEWCVTISPLVLSGESHRIVCGPGLAEGMKLVLDRAERGDRSLFTRWLRADARS